MGSVAKKVLTKHAKPFLISFLTLTIIFILKLIESSTFKRLGESVTVLEKFEFVYLNLPWMVVIIVPIVVLISVVLAFRNLRDDELFQKDNLYQVITPVLIASFFLSILMYLFADNILPDFNYQARSYFFEISKRQKSINFPRPLKANNRLQRGDREMDRKMMNKKAKEFQDIITKEIYKSEELLDQYTQNEILIQEVLTKLKRGEEIPEKVLNISESESSISNNEQEALLKKLNQSRNKIKYFQKMINKYNIEIHKKISFSLASIVFVIFGFPLGLVFARRNIFLIITIIGFIYLVYWGGLIYSEELARNSLISVPIAMWIPNFIFTSLGIILIYLKAGSLYKAQT